MLERLSPRRAVLALAAAACLAVGTAQFRSQTGDRVGEG
jgi:hypothetical protein